MSARTRKRNKTKNTSIYHRTRQNLDSWSDLIQTDLNEELKVNIIRLGRSALGLLALPTGNEIDTLQRQKCRGVTSYSRSQIRIEKPSASPRRAAEEHRRRMKIPWSPPPPPPATSAALGFSLRSQAHLSSNNVRRFI